MHFCSFSFQYSGAGLFDSPVCILECRIFWNYPTDLRKTHRKIPLILSYVGLVGEGDTVTYPWCDGVGNSDLIRIFETDFGYLCCNVCLVCPSTSWTTGAHRVQSSGGWWWCWGEEGVKSGWFIKAHWQLAGHYRADWVGVFPLPPCCSEFCTLTLATIFLLSRIIRLLHIIQNCVTLTKVATILLHLLPKTKYCRVAIKDVLPLL